MPLVQTRDFRPLGLMLAAASLTMTGCMWKSKAVYYSPDRKGSLEVLSRYPLNFETLRIRIYNDGEIALDKIFPQKCYLYFLDIAWSQDAERVGLFAKGLTTIEFAYNVKLKREIPFSEMRSTVSLHIKKEYFITSGNDPFDCGFCVGEFRKRYPERVTD